jgi:3-deoxy-D-manno-octulosonate 8-phosphate phosphatase (KDO 8-P phosphatase)
MNGGIEVAIISSSDAKQITYRLKHLGIRHVYVGVEDKLARLRTICQGLGISLNQVAYMGDDLTDLPILNLVGLPCAPADAVESVKQVAAIVTSRAGGHGAVRELCDRLLTFE